MRSLNRPTGRSRAPRSETPVPGFPGPSRPKEPPGLPARPPQATSPCAVGSACRIGKRGNRSPIRACDLAPAIPKPRPHSIPRRHANFPIRGGKAIDTPPRPERGLPTWVQNQPPPYAGGWEAHCKPDAIGCPSRPTRHRVDFDAPVHRATDTAEDHPRPRHRCKQSPRRPRTTREASLRRRPPPPTPGTPGASPSVHTASWQKRLAHSRTAARSRSLPPSNR